MGVSHCGAMNPKGGRFDPGGSLRHGAEQGMHGRMGVELGTGAGVGHGMGAGMGARVA